MFCITFSRSNGVMGHGTQCAFSDGNHCILREIHGRRRRPVSLKRWDTTTRSIQLCSVTQGPIAKEPISALPFEMVASNCHLHYSSWLVHHKQCHLLPRLFAKVLQLPSKARARETANWILSSTAALAPTTHYDKFRMGNHNCAFPLIWNGAHW